jgi:hypothetical protein
MRCLFHDWTRIWCVRWTGRDTYSCVGAPFAVSGDSCEAGVEEGEGQNGSEVEMLGPVALLRVSRGVPWEARGSAI